MTTLQLLRIHDQERCISGDEVADGDCNQLFRIPGILRDLRPHGDKCKYRQLVLHSLELVVSDLSTSLLGFISVE